MLSSLLDQMRKAVGVGAYQQCIDLGLAHQEQYPDSAALKKGVAVAFLLQNEKRKAYDFFKAAYFLDQSDLSTLYNMAKLQFEFGDYSRAEQLFSSLLPHKPEDRSIKMHLALIFVRQGKVAESLELYSQLLDDETSAELLASRAFAYLKAYELDKAGDDLAQALALEPLDAGVINNAYMHAIMAGQDDKALGYAQVMAEKVENKVAESRLAFMFLRLKKFKEGWAWHEKSAPSYQLDDFIGKKLRVYCDQGVGDIFHFLRLVNFLHAQGVQVSLDVKAALHPVLSLFSTVPFYQGDAVDYDVSIMSLPAILGMDETHVFVDSMRFTLSDDLAQHWAAKIPQSQRTKIGINWQGNPAHVNDSNRSMALKQFAPLLARDDLEFHSLHVGSGADQLANFPQVKAYDRDVLNQGGDYVGTVGLINQMDYVISVDTSTAHLAASMGKPTYVLLPKFIDWRWFTAGETSCWYPSMTLLRQERAGQWADVVSLLSSKIG